MQDKEIYDIDDDEVTILNYNEKDNTRALLDAIEWMWKLQSQGKLFKLPYNAKYGICIISNEPIDRKHFSSKYTEYCYRAMLYGFVRGFAKAKWTYHGKNKTL